MDFLKRGAKVEISGDDEGFRGSWYEGTVMRRLNKTKVLVEYNTIMEDEAGRRRLTEVLDFIQLRPPPPREKNPVFKLMDDVDAYHHDGWWEGVITEVLSDGRFAVFFRPTREQRKFRPSELRLHREWVDNARWLPTLKSEEASGDKGLSELVKKKTVEWNFSKGSQVEVKTDEDGFEGAWISATIVKKLSNDNYVVQYHALKNDDNTGFLREEVDGPNIRPQPPFTSSVKCFNVNQKVDASFNDCWWSGVITKVLEDKKYVVYFSSTDDELDFKVSQLRLHQDWINGEWVVPSPKGYTASNPKMESRF